MSDNQTLPNLPFSLADLDEIHMRYLGLTTTGTYVFFDAHTGSVYTYKVNSGYLRRNSSHTMDGRNTLVTKLRVQPDELFEALEHYVWRYRLYIDKRRKNRRYHV